MMPVRSSPGLVGGSSKPPAVTFRCWLALPVGDADAVDATDGDAAVERVPVVVAVRVALCRDGNSANREAGWETRHHATR
jgi:hypothetical protein